MADKTYRIDFKMTDGTTESVTFVSPQGESAYEYAKQGGYTGTEADFATKLAGLVTLNSWADVQKAVKSGKAPTLYPVGTQFLVNHKVYNLLVFTVVAHNHFKSPLNEEFPTMTLLCQTPILSMPFDHQEAIYCADTDLTSGNYYFRLSSTLGSWEADYYSFSLSKSLPAGGQLVINGDRDTALDELTISSYASNTSTTAKETVNIERGKNGKSLYTLGSQPTTNHPRRITQGSDNYKESDIRLFLNSTESSNIWKPQTKFDRPPSWGSNLAGFAAGFDDDFLSCVGEVIIPCIANDVYESPDSTIPVGSDYTVEDKFFLLSEKEIFGTNTTGAEDKSTLLEYYEGATNVDRIKYGELQAKHWWTRTPLANYPGSTVIVHTDGTSVSSSAKNPRMCTPACTIV